MSHIKIVLSNLKIFEFVKSQLGDLRELLDIVDENVTE
jgi:hypothetical protein